MTPLRTHLTEIFTAALDRVNPYTMITRSVCLEGETLKVSINGQEVNENLADYDRILLLGAGKASARMALAFEEILGDRISKGLICVKYGHTEPLRHAEVVESDHPVPDENGVKAARRLAELADEADEKTLVITCISGGGSALTPSPLCVDSPDGTTCITLADKQETTRLLLASGAAIEEINCVRKHISNLKGGRFLARLHPARSLTFILSDVIGDDLGSIASGMTHFDTTTFADALAILRRRGVLERVPQNVREALKLGFEEKIPETVKPGDPTLSLTTNLLIGTNRQALLAAADKARGLGYTVSPITARLCGEARHAAKVIADIARDTAASDMFTPKPACLIFGGETVVTLTGTGKGGRNQEIALAFLHDMKGWNDEKEKVAFLAASTDGNDGPTDAAGAFADAEILQKATAFNLSSQAALNANDAYTFFDTLNALHKTGPTNTNVCDLQIVLIT
ncbi:hydroxypyruvate reductase [Desulfoluna limicola]|uniref:Hydroxypyruvate reductase n=1 Tax=Desulfoluna limicola TaxID=2810562 RepID=A0ABM7PP81_9BACT|nr:glycerate kinase [Desulfoluna limicola]BCS99041.1 hydroxypyruvate reductase [Desulfoluna limicola]